jgi:hypothetical protein
MTSIFQVDWISIDVIIILLLLLLLIGVKIFKITHRWRYSFSNEASVNISFSPSYGNRKNRIISIRNWSLTRNSSIKERPDKPLILIFKTKNRRKLLRIITEGLSCYGFNVINLKAKIKHKSDNIASEKSFGSEWKSVISNIFDNSKMREVMKKLNYVIIDYSKKLTYYKQILTNSESKGIIHINPKISEKISSEYHKLYNNNSINAKIYTIFSRKSIFFLENKHLKQYIHRKNYDLKHLTIENARNSFKYYETILLGMIIDIIENKLL